MPLVTENDALGGSGSIADSLKTIAVTGLSRYIDGRLSQKYPLTSFNERATVNAEGQTKPASAPSKSVDALKGAFGNPVIIAVGLSALAAVLIFVATRRA